MKVISYAGLSRLRLRDFLSEGALIDVEESGMIGLVGLGGHEKHGETYFDWRQGESYRTAGISLDLGSESALTDEAARGLLELLGLPFLKGMNLVELTKLFGPPESIIGSTSYRFICGEREQYLLGCHLDEVGKLKGLFFARKDYCDEDDAL